MAQPQSEARFVNGNWNSISGIHRFPHQAMATTFEIIIQRDDGRYAQQAADAAFDELDHIEAELSRFIENSDISRINNLPAGQPLQIGLAAFECLQLSTRIYTETNGAFDITIGSLLSCWLNENKTNHRPSEEKLSLARQHIGTNLLKLDEAEHTVTLLTGPVQLDLGGIGKGYTADQMAEMLREWGIETALIHGGFSSVLALQAPPQTKGWPLTLSNPRNNKQTLDHLYLRDRAVSGSGLQKGQHIIDTRTARPVEAKLAAWACAPDAATADALSTAFMIMSPDEIEQYCSLHPDVSATLILNGYESHRDEILRFGPWNKLL